MLLVFAGAAGVCVSVLSMAIPIRCDGKKETQRRSQQLLQMKTMHSPALSQDEDVLFPAMLSLSCD